MKLALFKSKRKKNRDKNQSEMDFWLGRMEAEGGELRNTHYKYFYTEFWGMGDENFLGTNILDIGCGPRGSLEWADMTAQRFGLDPNANRYLKIQGHRHKMKYVQTGSEDMPFPDGFFDYITCFNALDHVDDLGLTIAEIKRVCCPGGKFLLITDVNHEPTTNEPVRLEWECVELFKPEFDLISCRHFEKHIRGIYESLQEPVEYDHENPAARYGILAAQFLRR